MSETPTDTRTPRRTRGPRRPPQNGAAIRSLREMAGWSQNQFAKAAQINQSNLSRIEDEKQYATPPTLKRIALTLRVPVSAIMRELEDSGASENVA